jgi:hypothetical protein
MENQTKYEIKEMEGTLHASKVKKTDAHPDVFGTCVIEGKTYKIAGWKQTSPTTGNEWTRLKLQEEIKPSDVTPTNDTPSNEPSKMPF